MSRIVQVYDSMTITFSYSPKVMKMLEKSYDELTARGLKEIRIF